MKTILVVNGESWWQEYFPGYTIVQKKIQHADWILKDGKLHVADAEGVCIPDGILWRVGAIRPEARHRTALEMIRLSGVPCVNHAATLLRGYDRLSMLHELQACGIPVIPFQVATSSAHLKNIQLPFPFVVKAGNYHGGFGKVLVDSENKWQDVKDLLFISKEYVTAEPYIRYERDVRYLAIGKKIWAMARRGRFWKANVETTDFVMMETEPEMTAHIRRVQRHTGADIIALDILEESDGARYVVEYNDIPGLSGFPEEAKAELARCLMQRFA